MDRSRVKSRSALIILLLVLLGCSRWEIKKGETPEELYRQGLAFYYKERYTTALERFQEILNRYPLSSYATEASLLIADSYYYRGDYEKAYRGYSEFASLHPTHPKAPYALFQKAMSAYSMMDTIDREQENTKKALSAFEDLIRMYPKSRYAERARTLASLCRRRLARHELYVGDFYFKKGHYMGAIGRFQRVVEAYPDSGVADRALFRMGEAYLKMGEKEKALEALSRLIDSFPNSGYAAKARKKVKTIRGKEDG